MTGGDSLTPQASAQLSPNRQKRLLRMTLFLPPSGGGVNTFGAGKRAPSIWGRNVNFFASPLSHMHRGRGRRRGRYSPFVPQTTREVTRAIKRLKRGASLEDGWEEGERKRAFHAPILGMQSRSSSESVRRPEKYETNTCDESRTSQFPRPCPSSDSATFFTSSFSPLSCQSRGRIPL